MPTATAAPQGNNVTPQFRIVVPAKLAASRTRRAPQFVSTATMSITITITNAPAGSTPTSVTTDISGASCASGCTVNGPPSPPGRLDNYLLTTFDQTGGVGNALDTATASITPVFGQTTTATVTMLGIPFSIVILGVPTNFQAGTTNQSTPLNVVVADHSGETITGTYANPVVINQPDSPTLFGVAITGTNTACGILQCVTMTGSSDALTFFYDGRAENPVTLTSSATGVSGSNAGTATFTPVLQPIVWAGGPTSAAPGNPIGIDLYTAAPGPVGWDGFESYAEHGYTDGPWYQTLTQTGAAACSTFATVQIIPNDGLTIFQADAIASPVAGLCTLTVTDGLTQQHNASPTFVVTYTTWSADTNVKRRR